MSFGDSAAPFLRRAAGALLALAAGIALQNTALAQPGGAVWISLDGQPAGTPARVELNTDLSARSQSYVDVFLSGFFFTTRLGNDGRIYQDISVPGLTSTSTPGWPRLPIVRVELGIVTSATGASLSGVTVFDTHAFSDYQVWPSPIPAQVHGGTPSQFYRDSTVYASTTDLPVGEGVAGVTRAVLGGIPASLCTAYPVHWNPSTGVLSVAGHARFGFSHPGPLTPRGLTKEHGDAGSVGLLNWGVVSPDYTIDPYHYEGSYLFVCPSTWMPTLQPLIQQKKTRGFKVTVINVPLSGETCAQLKQSIQNWYFATNQGADHYALLVGSFGSTPYCFDGYGQLSEKVLSSVDGDGEPEIFLGRLYVVDQTELQNQVTKILDYETGPQVNNDGDVLLVAHKQQDQDFNFMSYHEGVRNASYAQVTPNFITRYGTNPAVGNADVASDINTGVGVAAYIGHGEKSEWDRWTFADASFTRADALALANGAKTPVLWSIACDTGDPRVGLNLASGFMKHTSGGAVAFYGAVDPTYGPVTEVLEDSLFQAVYGRGVTRHGLAIALAEHAAIVADSLFGFDTAYKYILYGDPEMSIKRHNSGGIWAPIDLLTPISVIGPCPGVSCCPSCPVPTIDIQTRSAAGAPIAGVKVGVWKATSSGTDELLDNRYSGTDGWVHIPGPGLTAGTLYVGYDDGDGRSGLDSIEVLPPSISGVDEAAPRPLLLTARPNVAAGATRLGFGRPLGRPGRVGVYRVNGQLVRWLAAPTGSASVDWDLRDARGQRVAGGVYWARLMAEEKRSTTRLVVLR